MIIQNDCKHFLFPGFVARQGSTITVENGKPITILHKTNETLDLCYVKGPTEKDAMRSNLLPTIPTFSGLANVFRY